MALNEFDFEIPKMISILKEWNDYIFFLHSEIYYYQDQLILIWYSPLVVRYFTHGEDLYPDRSTIFR